MISPTTLPSSHPASPGRSTNRALVDVVRFIADALGDPGQVGGPGARQGDDLVPIRAQTNLTGRERRADVELSEADLSSHDLSARITGERSAMQG
jgi:hypothetical protein